MRYERYASLNVIIIVWNIGTQYYINYEKIWTHNAIVKHYMASQLSCFAF